MTKLVLVAAACILAAGCSIRSERVVEKPVPVPAQTTVYTTR